MSWTTDALRRLREAGDDERVRVVGEISTELRNRWLETDAATRALPRVELVGTHANVFAILAVVFRAPRAAGWSQEEQDAFKAEATAGDYDHLLRTVMESLDVE